MILRLKKRKILLAIILFIGFIGFLIPEKLIIPVENATFKDWNKNTFWFEPWGKSVVHKGIDIFGKKGTSILSASKGMVLYTGNIELGGNIVIVLGPKWRIHYYAHLDAITTQALSLLYSGETIGTLGNSGNAVGKSPHLHYSIVSLLPHFWQIDRSTQGWKKAFYLDPNKKLIDDHKE